MTSERVRVPTSLMKWVRETFEPLLNCNFSPTDNQLITHALYQLKANWMGEEIEIVVNNRKKCIKIK